jgi:hypothetical protein
MSEWIGDECDPQAISVDTPTSFSPHAPLMASSPRISQPPRLGRLAERTHTNGIESVWAVLKRGFYGTYHSFSGKHLQRYVDEFTFRLNEGNVKNHTMSRIDSLLARTANVLDTCVEFSAMTAGMRRLDQRRSLPAALTYFSLPHIDQEEKDESRVSSLCSKKS